jgi:aryl-alcohol dehydrogenase-like predicted oxidoreductase
MRDQFTLIAGARDLGVNVFDTSSIYGQGQSERVLGMALQDDRDVCIVTKAGFYYPLKHRALAPFRAPVAAVLKRSRVLSGTVRAARAAGLPRSYRPEHLRRSLALSLKRLRRAEVGAFLLHSPRLEDLADGAALDLLTDIKREGLALRVGVSCDDLPVLDAVSLDPRVDVIEAPFGVSRRAMEAGIAAAANRGALVLAREIFSSESSTRPPLVEEAVRFVAAHASVHVTLVGTTRLDHLRQAVEAAA